MSNPINTYFISDLHFGHENVIKFDNRPFRDLEHMHRVLINNWNSIVRPKDVIYVIGDIGLCKGEILYNIIKQLNGMKILIMGNHDKNSPTFYLRAGFSSVQYSASIMVAKEIVTMNHYPLLGVPYEDTTGMKGSLETDNWHKEHKFAKYALNDCGQFMHIHGHVHVDKKDRMRGKQYNVCAKANGYKPVSMIEIQRQVQIKKDRQNG